MDDPTNIPQQVDPVNNLSMLPGERLSATIPLDILQNMEPIDIKVYFRYYELATGREGSVFQLPERGALARSVGISIHTLQASERRLHERGWIQIVNFKQKGERTQRRRVLVKTIKYGLMEMMDVTEMYAQLKAKMSQALSGTVDGLHNMYSLPTAQPVGEPQSNISQILRSCRKADRRGQTLAHFNEQTILAVCHDASQSDIATAILEVERYNGKPSDILKLFAARFKDGKLNPERKGSFRVHAKADSNGVIHTSTPSATAIPVAISHDEFHSPATVDALCTSLNAHEVVERGKLPINALNTNSQIFMVDPDLGDPYVKLAGNVTLVRVAPGKWGIKWQQQSTGARGRQREARTASVGETLTTLASGALSSSIKV